MFQLSVPEREPGEPEDVIFLRSGDHIIGVIVDQVNDVVGVSSADIQPPHPLFGAINIRYISGVVESGDSLYIILASEMVFGDEITFEETPEKELLVEEIEAVVVEAQPDLDYTFVQESLQTFRSFYASELNEEWMRQRFDTWVLDCQKKGASVQLQDHDEADSYLEPFFSPHTGELWRGDYVKGIIDLLPGLESSAVAAWVIGAGDGHDAYSFACILRLKYPEASVKIWAHDSDLLSISSAPSNVYDSEFIPSEFEHFLTEGARGYTFNEEIRNSVYFE